MIILTISNDGVFFYRNGVLDNKTLKVFTEHRKCFYAIQYRFVLRPLEYIPLIRPPKTRKNEEKLIYIQLLPKGTK